MAKRILICTELSPQELRQSAFTAQTRRESMRRQAIANALEGMSRAEAARLADMSGQALKDAIKRYNVEGLPGLKDRPHTGRPCKLDATQREALHAIALRGPDIEKEHLSAYTRDDLAGIVKTKWQVIPAVIFLDRWYRARGVGGAAARKERISYRRSIFLTDGMSYDPTSIGRILRDMGLSRQKTRPSHPKKKPEAAEAFLKNAGRAG